MAVLILMNSGSVWEVEPGMNHNIHNGQTNVRARQADQQADSQAISQGVTLIQAESDGQDHPIYHVVKVDTEKTHSMSPATDRCVKCGRNLFNRKLSPVCDSRLTNVTATPASAPLPPIPDRADVYVFNMVAINNNSAETLAHVEAKDLPKRFRLLFHISCLATQVYETIRENTRDGREIFVHRGETDAFGYPTDPAADLADAFLRAGIPLSSPENTREILKRIKVELKNGYLQLDVRGDQSTGYPLFGDAASREKSISSFADELKKALAGERLSTLY